MKKLQIQQRGKGNQWYLRKSFPGVGQRWVCLDTPDKKTAETRARRFIETATIRGFDAASDELKGIAAPAKKLAKESETGITFEELKILYTEFCEQSANPVSDPTRASYLSALGRFFQWGNAKTLAELDCDNCLVGWKRENPSQKLTSYNSRMRQAAGVFKKPALKFYSKKGYAISNPFEGVEKQKAEIKPYSPLSADIRDKIWACSELTDDYKLIVRLALGCGLRAGEITAARLHWLKSDGNKHWIEVQAEDGFVPKSGESRQIPISIDFAEEIRALRGSSECPYLVPNASTAGKRLKSTLEKLTFWLQQQGVEARNPIHTLRKECGSLIATHHDIFTASKILGHASVMVTEKYYASLIRTPEINPVELLSK